MLFDSILKFEYVFNITCEALTLTWTSKKIDMEKHKISNILGHGVVHAHIIEKFRIKIHDAYIDTNLTCT